MLVVSIYSLNIRGVGKDLKIEGSLYRRAQEKSIQDRAIRR